ncbi:PocR ligand-binding domain-containing protein [Catenisphaera adipataccumulans]|jgi:ligand-binding sensor protein|uniref:Ligand-binding sensor protein n=1 Tax=Catenisphaera adipataccumulans TaxID=700500 RepID=A0A7W8FX03_9FIRM|nr:PocR ligand-binding domain-containing protein [Catenisphaera adipataccumulans]MBB5182467.1 ligand-binding sensor protein [Catenisphaera adipataccumulans]
MKAMEAIQKAMNAYEQVSGLRSYFVNADNATYDGAQERNYFCKCFKTSTKAVALCDEVEAEYVKSAVESNEVQTFACHAGVVKWTVPVHIGNVKGAIISEGVITGTQIENSEEWVAKLSEDFNVSRSILLENYDKIKVMNEDQAQASIEVLQKLLDFYAKYVEE